MGRELPFTPRGLSRSQAAAYLGIGVTLFDQLIEAGKMPRAKEAHGRVIWDRYALDEAFSELPDHGVDRGATSGNSWARARAARGQSANTA